MSLMMNIEFNKMNSTKIESAESKEDNSEFYLLVILVKLTILTIAKIVKSMARVYKYHNDKVIDNHNKTTIQKLQKKQNKANIHDEERGGQ